MKEKILKYTHEEGQITFTNLVYDEDPVVMRWIDYPEKSKLFLAQYGVQQKAADFKVNYFSAKDGGIPLLPKSQRLTVIRELDEMLIKGETTAKREIGETVSVKTFEAGLEELDLKTLKSMRPGFLAIPKMLSAIDEKIELLS